jgi:hypothetical protein
VSENGRFLVNGEGEPFFWLGDTAWELFHRLDRDEVDRYLEDRAGKGFTVIQAVALAELDGLRTPNAYGHVPLIDLDPTRPDVREGPDNDYWDHVDYVVAKAESLGLFVALLPSWGDKWVLMSWGKGPIVFDEANARVFGEWIGRRYAGRSIVWVMGGDRAIASDTHRAIIAAMATGVRAGDGGAGLMTFHPPGGSGSAEWWHDAPWLDFNMRQNGHGVVYTTYARTLDDYRRTPVKPVLDAEPVYEDHPIAFRSSEYGNSVAADVRRPLQRRLRTHLWSSLRLADVGSGAGGGERRDPAVDGGARRARGRADALREVVDGVSPDAHAHTGSRVAGGACADERVAGGRVLSLRRDAGSGRHLRDGVRADRSWIHGEARSPLRVDAASVVVRSARWIGAGVRGVSQRRRRAHLHLSESG